MPDELDELLDTAIYKEIASEALYMAELSKTQDPGARTLMKGLAQEERKHSQWLKDFKDKGGAKENWHRKEVPNLMISEYMLGPDTVDGAGLQETLVFAMKREQQAVEFYSKMMGIMRDESAKNLCERLVHDELKHKLRLEIFYDDLFYRED